MLSVIGNRLGSGKVNLTPYDHGMPSVFERRCEVLPKYCPKRQTLHLAVPGGRNRNNRVGVLWVTISTH